MDKLTNIASTAVNRYFKTLSTFGYKSYTDVNKLIVLIFIEELLNSSEFSFYISEEDYKIITNSLYCLYGSDCMIDFPEYNVEDELIHQISYRPVFRLSEESSMRFTEDNNTRIYSRNNTKGTLGRETEITIVQTSGEEEVEYVTTGYVESKKVRVYGN